jgi:predicted CopG family antitoxin
MSETTTIPVTKEVRDRLKRYGTKGETYSDILKRLMDEADYETFMERQYKKFEEKEKFVSLDEI